ncbi:MAG: efflux RND transporter periplasmic adaptor subunit [Sphingobacteriales bacterium]|nr:efflux RND transporter periplasmic adaptor subunit [Sphingobacteriales bacterium]MBI3717531.1 efflux RND transporter periplasmic adaptor subunit [Sphingobacteriales bacterium]
MKYLFVLILSILLFACKSKKTETPADPDVYYTCSMDPQVKENKPGKCPVCKMDLTIAKKISGGTVMDEIELSEQQVQLGNILMDTIRSGSIGDQVVLTATLNFDQLKENAVSSRVMGRVEKLYFKNIGDYVSKGAKLFDLYSEELNNAKQEYLLQLEKQKALDNSLIDFDQLVQAAKNKLLLWGMSEAQIQELAKNKKATPLTSFYSNAGGYITTMDVKEGDYVTEGGTVVRLADLTSLWAEAQIYSSQLSFIDKGGQATVQFPDMQGKEVKGKIEFINPEINPDTRINLVRVTIPNPGNKLKPGMQAYVSIKNKEHNSLSLPTDAVIRDNKGASVWIQTSGHKFKYKMVEIGLESNDRVEIKSGLKDGDVVVISGAYLLNSEYIFKIGSNPMEGMKM